MERFRITRRGALIGSGVALAGHLAGCSPSGQNVLRATDTHPTDYPTVEAVRFFGSLLEERSGGRFTLEMYPGSVLGQEKDSLELTIFGGIDINRVSMAPLNSIVPETIVPNLPFMFRSVAHMRAAMDGAPGQSVLGSLESHGLIGLCFYDSGARSFYTTSRSINEPADLSGLKIRVQSSELFVSMVEALGGNPTPMDYGEVFQGLLQGTVDGAENNWPSYESSRHFEAAKYYSLTRHVMVPEVLTMSAKRWDTLSADDQDLVRVCARDSVPYMRELWDARVAASKQILLDAGVIVTEPDIAPFEELMQPVWSTYLTTPALRRLAEDIRQVVAP